MTHRAYGYARLSAQRSSLLTIDDIAASRCASDQPSAIRAAQALGIESEAKRFERLLCRYRLILDCYEEARPLIRALLRLHEIENVKLGWRAIVRAIDVDRWTPLWRDFRGLGTVSIAIFRQSQTLYDVVGHLADTPFARIAADVFRAYPDDLASAEFAFDRWASLEVVAEAAKLEKSETLARQIAEAIVVLRDREIASRGRTAYGLSAEAIEAARALPDREIADLQLLCRRAFRGQATQLAPAIAFAASAERDYRIARALVERAGDADLDAVIDCVAADGRSS